MSAPIAAVICLAVWNAAAFCVTALDKRAARLRRRRIPERRFVFFAATLGGAGTLAAFYVFRHKTQHTALLAGVWTLTLASYALLLAAVWIFRD